MKIPILRLLEMLTPVKPKKQEHSPNAGPLPGDARRAVTAETRPRADGNSTGPAFANQSTEGC